MLLMSGTLPVWFCAANDVVTDFRLERPMNAAADPEMCAIRTAAAKRKSFQPSFYMTF